MFHLHLEYSPASLAMGAMLALRLGSWDPAVLVLKFLTQSKGHLASAALCLSIRDESASRIRILSQIS